MDFIEKVEDVADRAQDQLDRIDTEEATKQALVIPFIKALGYDVYDLNEVVPEFTADFADQKDEKVDYAILHEDEPVVLIESKAAGAPCPSATPSSSFAISRSPTRASVF